MQKQQKMILPSFLLEHSQDPLAQNQGDFRQPHLQEYFHHNYAYHLLFKDQQLTFLHLTPLRHNFFPTSYRITENEFGLTVFTSIPFSYLALT